MALFGKKKLSLDEILDAVNNLSPEEKEELGEKMTDLYKAEDEREIDKIEEEKADSEEVKDEKGEEVNEESEEIGKDVDEVKEDVAEDEGETVSELEEYNDFDDDEDKPDEDDDEEHVESPEVQEQEDARDDAQSAKIEALEQKVALLEEQLEKVITSMENQDFGLNPSVPEGGGEDHSRMHAVMRGYAGGNASKYY